MSPELTEVDGVRRFDSAAIQRQIDATTDLMDVATPGTVVAVVDYAAGGRVKAAVVAKTPSGAWTVVVEGYKDFGESKDAGARLGVRWVP